MSSYHHLSIKAPIAPLQTINIVFVQRLIRAEVFVCNLLALLLHLLRELKGEWQDKVAGTVLDGGMQVTQMDVKGE